MPDFSFLIASDLHFIDDACRPFFKRMVKAMKTVAPDAAFLAVLGDLGEMGTATELESVRHYLDAVGLPLRVVPGNHDWTGEGDRSAFQRYFRGPVNYTFEQGDWQFVALDSAAGRGWEGCAVPDSSLAWLDETLPTLDRARPTALLTHFPLGEGVKYQVTNAAAVLDRFRSHNLRYVFSGHYHAHTERRVGDTLITTTACCSFARHNHDKTEAKGFAVARTRVQTIERQFIPVG